MKVFAALLLAIAIQADIAQDTQGVEKRSLHTRNSPCDVLQLQSIAVKAMTDAQNAHKNAPTTVSAARAAATLSENALVAQGRANACVDAKNKADQSALDQQAVKDAADCAAYDARVIADKTARKEQAVRDATEAAAAQIPVDDQVAISQRAGSDTTVEVVVSEAKAAHIAQTDREAKQLSADRAAADQAVIDAQNAKAAKDDKDAQEEQDAIDAKTQADIDAAAAAAQAVATPIKAQADADAQAAANDQTPEPTPTPVANTPTPVDSTNTENAPVEPIQEQQQQTTNNNTAYGIGGAAAVAVGAAAGVFFFKKGATASAQVASDFSANNNMNPLYKGMEQFDNPLYDTKGSANPKRLER